MFYWDKSSNGFDLESQLQTMQNVEAIYIATAYLSGDGVDILRRLIDAHSINKEKVTVFLSTSFSDEHPSDILIELNKIAKVRIAKTGRLFHPKFYYIKGKEDSLLLCGSSNLTLGGFGKNVEFDLVCKPSSSDIIQMEKFVQFCISQTDMLTEEYIEFYKSQENKLDELKNIKSKIEGQLGSFDTRNDPFTAEKYDLTDFYFNFEDYETFFSRNSTKDTITLRERRKSVQEKLLAIHKSVESQVNRLNLFAHWDKSNITSLTFPSAYNKFTVDWMGVRYGKHKDEIVLGGGVKEIYESFTKHACLQYNVYPSGFEIVLFFAVPTDAVDRSYLAENIDRLADSINRQAQAMKGYGLVWQISGCPNFNFDTDDDLASYLRINDCDGKYSSLNMHFEPNDPRIKTLDNICKEVIDGFKLLKPLYDIIVWRGRV